MGWERDVALHGRPYKTGFNAFVGAYEYGSLDQEAGLSFADAMRGIGFKVAEGVVIPSDRISLDGLLEICALEFGPATSDVVEPPVLDNVSSE